MPWPHWNPREQVRADLEYYQKLKLSNPRAGREIDKTITRLEEELAQATEQPLAFLGQIVLSESPSVPELGLPDQGVLLFFYEIQRQPWGFDPRTRGCAQVLYLPYAPVGNDFCTQPDSLARVKLAPATIQFAQEWTLPEIVEDTFSRITRGTSDYHNLLSQLYGNQSTLHRIGGNPQQIQGDMQLEAQLVSHGIYCGNPDGYRDPRAKMLEPGAKDWELLFQIDTDEDGPGFIWGDVGRLYFWIRRDDREHRNFDEIWCGLQCY